MNKILVIPSIDIKDGKTVRVVQGIPELGCNQYGNDPIETAMMWRTENAKVIHVVDFDLSHKHSYKNLKLLGEICESVIIPVQFGGGINSFDDAQEAFELGAFRLVIGSLSHDNPEEFKKIFEKYGPHKIASAIDVVNNEVIIHGRKIKTGITPIDFAYKLSQIGIKRFVVTDVSRNGMLQGPNIELSKQISIKTNAKITISGGVSNYKDLLKIQEHTQLGIDSVIVGRALYENKFPCQKLWRIAEAGIFD